MKKITLLAILLLITNVAFSAVVDSVKKSSIAKAVSVIQKAPEPIKIGNVLSKDDQSKFTPESVVADLMSGNDRYVNGTALARDSKSQVKAAASGQYPKAIVIGCIDSRVDAELVFDQGIGDIFVSRMAGNVIDNNVLGGIEYACGHAGAKVVAVLGHGGCGAVKAGVDNVREGNIASLVSAIKPAVNNIVKKEKIDKKNITSANADLVDKVVKDNVLLSVKKIREGSKELSHLEHDNKIKIVPMYYNIETGKITILE